VWDAAFVRELWHKIGMLLLLDWFAE